MNNTNVLLPHATNITKDDFITLKWKNIPYVTKSIQDTFENIPTDEILPLIQGQYKVIKKEADILLKYNQLSQSSYELTLQQYKDLFYYEQCFYPIYQLKEYITKENQQFNTIINKPQQSTVNYPESKIQQQQTIQQQIVNINRQAIRNITGYSPYFTPKIREWSTTYVERQDRLIQDEAKLVLVLASRQSGKSLTISEKAIEESHLPNNDILVWAFRVASTDYIRNYIRKFIRKFPDWYFEEYKAERYFLNTKTWSKIYFRTLSEENDAVEAVRWMTINTVIVDEAQLVSEYAFEEVLRPTLATTAWKMILIWTPPKVPDWYFVSKIFQFKKWELPKASYYEIKLPDQPFADPDTREEMMKRQDEPRVQRERFCNLTTDVELLFQPKLSTSFPQIQNSVFLVIWIDPARKWDRSWYIVFSIQNWKAYSIESWFIPDTFKSDWKLQAVYLKKIKNKYIEKYKNLNDDNIFTVIDSSWVWDWVVKLFQDYWLKLSNTVRYTSWMTKTQKNLDYTVSKSILINNTLDMITENQFEIVDLTNKDLLEELKYIYETESRTWLIWFKSKFYDDITNSMLIALFIINERKLLSRSMNKMPTITPSSWNPFVDAMEWLWQRPQVSSIW